MKKLLLASAALALSAGLASAQGVTVSGDARMGIDYDDTRSGPNVSNWQFTSRARVIFTLSGQSDTGLNFGASFRADQNRSAGVDSGNAMTGGTVFISGAFGRLTMGDAAGAARHNVGDLAFTSLTGIGDPNEMQYLDRLQQGGLLSSFEIDDDESLDIADRRTAVRYDYTMDGFTFSLSLDQLRKYEFVDGDDLDGTLRVRGWAVGGAYDFGMGKVSAGYEDVRFRVSGDTELSDVRASHFIVGAEATFEGITVKGIYGRAGSDLGRLLRDSDLSRDQYGLSVSARFDEITVSAFGNRDFLRGQKVGIGASYDLGGGARVVGSVARVRGFDTPFDPEDRTRVSRTRADFGVAMSF
jgi:outer membrane protein OmpU